LTVGETLSRARRKRKLSVEDVAADTRIRATLIAAIEAGHFEQCGGAVYARGHIRSIARVVGVDSAPLIEEFDAINHVEKPVAAVAPTTNDHATDLAIVARAEHRKPNWTIATAVALAVICVLAVAGLMHGRGKAPGTHAGQPSTPSVQQSRSTTPNTPPATATNVSASRATMLIRTTRGGRTWLQVSTKSGQELFSGILEPGQHKLFSDRRGLAYVIGNAPAVDVVVNGNDVGSPPSPSVVARGSVIPGKGTLHQT
jgi:cytoskeletal protein RodZ